MPEPEPPRRPAAPPQNGRRADEGTGRRAAPEPPPRPAPPQNYAPPVPEDTGTRPRPTNGPPANGAPPAGRRAAAPPSNDFFAPTGEGTGNRTPRPIPEDGRRRADGPGAGPRRPEDGGRRGGPRPANGAPNGYAGRPDDAEPRRPAPTAHPDAAGDPSRRIPANGRPRPEAGPHGPQDPTAAPRRLADGGGRRPEVPGAEPGRRLPDGSGPRRRPENLAPDTPGRSPDGSGPRRHPEGLAPDAPSRQADGSGPRRRPENPAPDAPGRRSDAPDRRAEIAPDGIGQRLGDAPRPGENTGRRLHPGPPPADSPRRPENARRPEAGDAPRRPANGSGPHDLTGGPQTGRRPRPEDPAADPRRPADGPRPGAPVEDPTGRRPDGSGPRRLAEGGAPVDDGGRPPAGGPRRLAEGPSGLPEDPAARPRRLAEGPPADDLTGRHPDGSGPRRLAETGEPVDSTGRRPDGSGPRPAGDVAGRRFAADGAAAAPPAAPPVPAPIADRLTSGRPEPREAIDPSSLTTEMEAISDDVKKRREVDHTLARFSAVHDELAEQERIRKERRQKLMPWKAQEEDEDATEYASPVDVPDEGGPRRRGRTAKHSKIVRLIKVVSLTAAILVFMSTGLTWGTLLYIDSKFTEIEALNTDSAAVHQAEKQLGDENFLIIGSDTRAGAKPEDGVGDPNSENTQGARSDVLMLAHIPADRKRMVVVSVPRDLLITRPECESWDPSTGEYTGTQLERTEGVKANEPYAVGGPKCVSKFMTELTGLDINHFISVDFNGFKGMVDAIGTVEVCVQKQMDDEELGMIFDKPGKYEINGTKALDYVRARKVEGESKTDFDRVTRQQQFLSALLRKALSSEILLNPGKLNGFLNAFAASTVGQNVGVNDMLTLAQSMQSLEAGRVSFVTVPRRTDEGETLATDDNLELLREPETKALFQAIIDGTPLPDETPDTTVPDPNKAKEPAPAPGPKQGKIVDHKGLKVQVRNGDPDNGGAARETTEALRELGYDVVISDNAPPTDKTVIKYGIGGEDAAATLQSSVPGATLVFDAGMGGAVLLLIGPGWDEEVRAPQPAGAEPNKPSPPPNLDIVNAAKDPCA
ncbi:LCP family glycopolymer transferase [Saccharothrix sp. NRRL B-16314]|uniref:LCP family glycopolymer transferase n=1 Tax=Saccharothrix sp. NRRL B-16314 TaxID=1463825 RepID=UPI0012DF236A|nr:LCP family protein [Saccharothrix sp. NRRL B-16314]